MSEQLPECDAVTWTLEFVDGGDTLAHVPAATSYGGPEFTVPAAALMVSVALWPTAWKAIGGDCAPWTHAAVHEN